jgi:hypothetical protein
MIALAAVLGTLLLVLLLVLVCMSKGGGKQRSIGTRTGEVTLEAVSTAS